MQKRTCGGCGADITARHGNARFCRTCRDGRVKIQTGQGARSAPCMVDDSECVAGRLRKGMCERHYRRLKTTGSTDAPGGKLYHLSRYRVSDGGCWLWTGPMFWNGYGHISAATFGTTLAHRAFYEAHRGPIIERDLDHLCRVRQCVNPEHLEPVTHSENIIRGIQARSSGR